MRLTDPATEIGSDQHFDLTGVTTESWLARDVALFGSGRHALLAAARRLLADDGVLYVPTYFCHEVTSWLERHLTVVLFDHGPFEGESDLRIEPSDVALMVEYFGERSTLRVSGGSVIIDRTHLPWASHVYGHRPGAVIGSLRKALPLPDGGFCLFAEDLPFEPKVTEIVSEWDVAVSETLLGMVFKAQYLSSGWPDKAEFLSRIKTVEHFLVDSPDQLTVSNFTHTFAQHFDVAMFDKQRRINQKMLYQMTSEMSETIDLVNTPSHMMLSFPSLERRDTAREAMIAQGVFPAILWDQSSRPVPSRQRHLAETTLFLSVDHRYNVEHLERLAAVIAELR